LTIIVRRLIHGGSSINRIINNGKSWTSNTLPNNPRPRSFAFSMMYRDNVTDDIADIYAASYDASSISSYRVRSRRCETGGGMR
jgi:hypothetical protein